MDHRHYFSLFPNSDEEQPDRLFEPSRNPGNTRKFDHYRPEYDGSEDEEVIDEQLLKKTSELHEALRNIKLLRFQLVESRIMKRKNLIKCSEQELKTAAMQEKKSFLQQQNEDLDREIQIYTQKVRQQKQSNRSQYGHLKILQNQLNQAKVQQKGVISKAEMDVWLQGKENMSGVANSRYISLEKLTLQAQNKGSEEMISLIKQEITSTKKRFAEAEAKKHQLQSQYKKLLQQLKKQENHHKKSKQKML